ncbi:hypothetical protein [Methylobacterium oxalidis]|uniref:hypothetical protein n=1 Tax=Methylobacterium oxalidis TaxID=944322 RepID=UPI0033157C6B
MLRAALVSVLALMISAPVAWAQDTKPAPPVPESKPSTARPAPQNADLNWLWFVLALTLLMAALYYFMQRRA